MDKQTLEKALDNLANVVPFGQMVLGMDRNGGMFLNHVKMYVEALRQALEEVSATSGPGSDCTDEERIQKAWEIAEAILCCSQGTEGDAA